MALTVAMALSINPGPSPKLFTLQDHGSGVGPGSYRRRGAEKMMRRHWPPISLGGQSPACYGQTARARCLWTFISPANLYRTKLVKAWWLINDKSHEGDHWWCFLVMLRRRAVSVEPVRTSLRLIARSHCEVHFTFYISSSFYISHHDQPVQTLLKHEQKQTLVGIICHD